MAKIIVAILEATIVKKVPNERKLIYAIHNFIVASWCLLFSYGSHLNTTTNLKVFFGDVNFSVNRNRDILKYMLTLNGTYLRTKIIIYLNILLYIAILYLTSIPVNLLKKITPINIAKVIYTNILEMHCLNCYVTKWRICMNTNINTNIWATSMMR